MQQKVAASCISYTKQYLKHGWCYVWSIRYISIIIVVKFKVGDHEEWQIIGRHVHQIELSDLWHFPKDTLKIAFKAAESHGG